VGDRCFAGSALQPLPAHTRISVVMPIREAATSLPRAVAAVVGQDRDVDEIIVAVGPSRDDTRAVAQRLEAEHDCLRVVDNPSGRTPDGLNAAIAASSGDILVRVDAQAVIPPHYVGRAVDTLARTGAANVGGVQVPVAEEGFARAVAAAMQSPLGSGGAAYRGRGTDGPVDTVYLGVFRRQALEAVGGYDPTFVRNQDAELNQRLREAGFTVWLDHDLQVLYTPRGTLRGLARQYLQYGRWRRLNARLHPGSLRLRQLAPPALLVGLLLGAVASVLAATWWPMGALAAAYVVLVLGAAASAAAHPAGIGQVAAAMATMHLCWAVGFLLGPPRGVRPRAATSTTDC
jgi:succinoglycan biosynthesis protein ExoA